MAGSGFKIDASEIFKGLSVQQLKVKFATEQIATVSGPKMSEYAKEKRPWEDRTGHARGSIEGGYVEHGDQTDIYVSGNTEYFPYLELCNEKKNAILWPTVEKFGPEILKQFNKIIE